jgi:hypothetical protein
MVCPVAEQELNRSVEEGRESYPVDKTHRAWIP